MPNPSELQRLEEEYNFNSAAATDLRFSKGYREEKLRECRKYERMMNIPADEWVKI